MSASSLRGLFNRSSRITAWRSLVSATAHDAGLRSARFNAARNSAGAIRPRGSSSVFAAIGFTIQR